MQQKLIRINLTSYSKIFINYTYRFNITQFHYRQPIPIKSFLRGGEHYSNVRQLSGVVVQIYNLSP